MALGQRVTEGLPDEVPDERGDRVADALCVIDGEALALRVALLHADDERQGLEDALEENDFTAEGVVIALRVAEEVLL